MCSYNYTTYNFEIGAATTAVGLFTWLMSICYFIIFMNVYIICVSIHLLLYQKSDSESLPKKVELIHVHSKEQNYCESLHIIMKFVITPNETNLTVLIFIS